MKDEAETRVVNVSPRSHAGVVIDLEPVFLAGIMERRVIMGKDECARKDIRCGDCVILQPREQGLTIARVLIEKRTP